MPRGVGLNWLYDEARLQGRLWTPSVLHGLAGWWDAVLAGGATNSGILDLSRQGRTLSYLGTPSIISNGVRLDGNNQAIINTATGISATANVTLVMLVTPYRNNGGYDGFFSSTSSLAGNDYSDGIVIDQGPASTTSLSRIGVEGAKGGTNTDLMSGDLNFGQPIILSLTYAASTTRLRVNGGQFRGTRSTNSTLAALSVIAFGVRRYDLNPWQSGSYSQLDFHAAALWTRELSVSEIEATEGALAWSSRMQAVLLASHPFVNRPPLIGD